MAVIASISQLNIFYMIRYNVIFFVSTQNEILTWQVPWPYGVRVHSWCSSAPIVREHSSTEMVVMLRICKTFDGSPRNCHPSHFICKKINVFQLKKVSIGSKLQHLLVYCPNLVYNYQNNFFNFNDAFISNISVSNLLSARKHSLEPRSPKI